MHISDGILAGPTCIAGYAAAGGLIIYGLKNAKQADMPKAGLLTASFFLASLVRIPLPGTSVHLLLASLSGIALGPLCFPSIFIALLLQAVLLGHGGVSTLGVNMVMMAVPAFFAGVVFRQGLKMKLKGWWVFSILVFSIFTLGTVFLFDGLREIKLIDFHLNWVYSAVIGLLFGTAALLSAKYIFKAGLLFRWGFTTGAMSVLLAALAFYLILSYAPLADHTSREGFTTLARFAFVSHIPVVIIEGLIVAMLIKYLNTVSPDLLAIPESLGKGQLIEKNQTQ